MSNTQKTLPDFVNLSHFEHTLFAGVSLLVVFAACHRVSHRCSEDPWQIVVEIDPDDPKKYLLWLLMNGPSQPRKARA